MGLDALDAALGPGLDHGRRGRTFDEPVVVRRRGAHQQRAGAAGEHRRHVGRLGAGRCVADAVDAGVDDDEGAARDAGADLRLRDSGIEEASPRHDPMGSAREPRDQRVSPGLVSHNDT
jgi:hypothetical protein